MGYGKLIGAGKVAEVFEYDDGRVVKLYRAGEPKMSAFREAAVLAVAEAGAIAAPRAQGVVEVDGRWGVVMDRVAGRPFAEPMLAEPEAAGRYLAELARLQASLHAAPGAGLTSLTARLAARLDCAPGVEQPVRQRLRERLAGLPDGDRLLHGDFHPYNVMGQPRSATVVDWLDATAGPPAADACRSWVLMHAASPAIAEAYLAAYLAVTRLSRDDVLAWLPVVAAARLTENVAEQDADLRRWAAEFMD